MKTALILGVKGQDGFYLSSLLRQKDYKVIGYAADIRSRKLLEESIRINQPDEIYNLVGQAQDRRSFDYPDDMISVICQGTLNILEAIRTEKPDARYFQPSSSEIYGSTQGVVDEGCTVAPGTPYASSRLFAQNLVSSYRSRYGLHFSSGILFNHESPRRDTSYVTRKITSTVAKIKMGIEDKLFLGNVGAVKDWGFAGDYVEAMWLMLQQNTPDDYIIATGVPTSVLDFARLVFNVAELENISQYIEFKESKAEGIVGDSAKAKDKLGWQPTHAVNKLAEMMYRHDMEVLSYEN